MQHFAAGRASHSHWTQPVRAVAQEVPQGKRFAVEALPTPMGMVLGESGCTGTYAPPALNRCLACLLFPRKRRPAFLLLAALVYLAHARVLR